MLLIFIGIRNAWDIVTFIATGGIEQIAELDPKRLTGAEPKLVERTVFRPGEKRNHSPRPPPGQG